MERRRRDAVLGLAVIMTLAGVLVFAFAISKALNASWVKAVVALLVFVVVWIIAFNLFVSFARLRQRNRGGD